MCSSTHHQLIPSQISSTWPWELVSILRPLWAEHLAMRYASAHPPRTLSKIIGHLGVMSGNKRPAGISDLSAPHPIAGWQIHLIVDGVVKTREGL